MRLNENSKLVGEKLVFVPYKKHHVEKYHNWMQSKELLEKTASEPLSLEEEYQMQYNWWQDEDKCTFILLDKTLYNENEIGSMVGDVNLFFNNPDHNKEAEVEVMIAEKSMRGKGFGKEAVVTMMFYGFKVLNVEKYSVKIGFDNIASINLFTKLGFKEESRSDVFQEITYTLDCCSDNFAKNIEGIEVYFQQTNYDC